MCRKNLVTCDFFPHLHKMKLPQFERYENPKTGRWAKSLSRALNKEELLFILKVGFNVTLPDGVPVSVIRAQLLQAAKIQE